MRRILAATSGLLGLLVGGLALSILAAGRTAVRAPAPRSASGGGGGGEAAAVAAVAPVSLGDTGLYADRSLSRVRAEHLAFAPQYPLWTDGARKLRWMSLPPGSWIDATSPDAWVFPAGTRLWKEFSFGDRRIETRYMQRRADGSWLYATYLWNEAGTDAVLAPARGVPNAVEIAGGVSHAVPAQGECRACHGGAASPVLGFGALQLSSDRDPGALHAEELPPGSVDLSILLARGLVRGLPARLVATPPRIVAASAVERAALGYLHGNCGGCHNDTGPLASLEMSLVYALDGDGAAPAKRTTFGRPSRFPLPSAPGAPAVRVAPGDAARSVVSARLGSRSPLSQMPPMGTRLVDQAAVQLIDQWIEEQTQENQQ